MKTLDDGSKKILDEAESMAQKHDVNYEIVSLKGQSAGSITLEYDRKNNFALIIMGSRGRGKIKTTILGSASNHVFNHTKKPLLVVKSS